MTRNARFKREVRARMARTGEAYTAARALLMQGERTGALLAPNPSRVLQITNGESAARSLQGSGIEGGVLSWRDVLHDGPVPGGLAAGELRGVRAEYLATRWHLRSEDMLRDFTERDDIVQRHRHGRYVLWFEADLYDQLQLIQVMSMLGMLDVKPDRVSLVCIGEYPEIPHFGGLGELQPSQLADLYPRREQIDQQTLDLAANAWATFRSQDPTSLTDAIRWSSRRLRFLSEAFSRLAEEYPWQSDGLPLTQRRILAAVARGPLSMVEVFHRIWRKERRPYLGDWSCYSYIRELASAPHPLLRNEGRAPGDPPATGMVGLTDVGAEVLAGNLDHVALNGVDKWIGGVQLRPGGPDWRYDGRLETLMAQA